MLMRSSTFPPGEQFALTWAVEDEWGGMTSAMLHRSRAIARGSGARVTVLTFDPDPDYPAREERLRASGELTDGVRLLNLWDWLRTNDLPGGRFHPDAHLFTPIHTLLPSDDETVSERHRSDVLLSRTRSLRDGTVLQTDHFRTDGTLLLTERRDSGARGRLGGKSVVLCDRGGQPLRSWGRIAQLYRCWLDELTGAQPCFLIIDSKTVARWAIDYHAPSAITMHLVHGSHLEGDPARRTLRASRKAVFEHLDGFDAVVLLTNRQRDDVVSLLGPHHNLEVIPNSRELPPHPTTTGRPAGEGIMLASLTARKRVDHAMRAVLTAREHGADASLSVWGEGEAHGRLAAQTDDHVRLEGYDPHARDHLRTASFLLMTSTSEGFPLTLVESLASGCVPISYDIPYGPADIIEDGVNGFLVANGDVAGMARAIERFVALPEGERERMRRAAVASAARFSDDAVNRAWGQAMRRAMRRKSPRALAWLHR